MFLSELCLATKGAVALSSLQFVKGGGKEGKVCVDYASLKLQLNT